MLNVHPLVVHFPIALLMAAAVVLGLGVWQWSERLIRCARVNLWLGTLGAAVAVRTGLWAEEAAQHSFEIHQVMERHEALGLWVLGLSATLSLLSVVAPVIRSRRWQWALLAGLVATAVVLGIGARYGGRLVYEYGVGTSLVAPDGAVAPPHEH